ncbi:MarR family winged helix-turn-helix transcriptional regulator [Candidatus Leptofilum sp.]|uniref:MarR family winged helix-turn-helix transcriptional regulator n=1 Tax=Candidatus Leptofilum sp. TaxID=3241576 RepID=UPI003B5926C2
MDTNRHQIAVAILQIIPSVMRLLAAELRQGNTPMQPPQLGVLTLLAEKSRNLSELAEQHAVSLPTMSSTVSKLVAAGWIERQRSQQDRRVVMLALTPTGQAIVQEIGQKLVAQVADHLSAISDNDLKTLEDGLAILQTVYVPFSLKNSGATSEFSPPNTEKLP